MGDEVIQEFLTESWENLSRLDTEVVALEKNPGNAELLASIFRTIHTIKGTCGFLGLNRLGSVAHSAENVLGQMREHLLEVTPRNISLVLEGVDRIKELLKGLETDGEEPPLDSSQLIARLDALAEGALGNPQTAGPEVHTSSLIQEVEEGSDPPGSSDSNTIPAQEPALAAQSKIDSKPSLPQNSPAPAVNHPEPDGDHGESRKTVADLSIRVGVGVLDTLMNLVGELVLTRNQLLQMVRGEDESKYAGPITHLNRVTTDLQEGVMKTRMQPIGNAWSKLPRLVRDLAAQTGKQIELDMIGAETELDRTVLDAIKDPLTHMVRNSADHGIELATTRVQKGKPEAGRIKLQAFHEGGHVIICIEDDGAGINVDRVKEKAIRQGLISEADASRMSDKELLSIIFQPGFSTAEKVTSVSGRGVGMDVVKTQIERIGGTVELQSRQGLGTKVRIKIPLTLAIVSALVVESGSLSFAVPQLGVVELVRLAFEDRHKIERINRNEVFRLRNRLLPLVHLHECLGLPRSQKDDKDVNIVVVQVGEEQFGVIVSEVFDTEEIVVKPVGALLKDLKIYQGTTILGDGRVIMILDIGGIASEFAGNLTSGERDTQRDNSDLDEKTSLLLFETGSTTMAVPLSLVARLEEFPQKAIEYSGDREVVQYRGDLLPLIPIQGSRSNRNDPQQVVVFTEGKHSLGLLVDRIQDILEEHLVIRMQSRKPGTLGTAIINGKATDLLDIQHYIRQTNPDWFRQESSDYQTRILVIDDSIFFRQLVTTTLEAEGFRVLTVRSAVQAVELLERGGSTVDLIVSDVEMPMMDGFEFAEWIRKRPVRNDVPMIAITSRASAQMKQRCLEAGFNCFLRKFDSNEFMNAVRELAPSVGSEEAIR